MIKDERFRGSAPDERNRTRARLVGRVLLTLVFSGAQVWSAGVLVDVIGSGIALFAFALVMSAALIAVLDAWREIWRFAAVSRTSVECGG